MELKFGSMANYTIENPKGIDQQIQFSQNDIFKGLDWGEIDVYGRVRKNPVNDGFYPEAYIGNNEYRDVYLNDEVNATIIFIKDGDSEVDEFGAYWTSDVKCVVMVNLEKIYPNIAHRADTESQIAVITQLEKNKMFSITGTEEEIADIFQGFKIDKIATDNMQPYHIFAVLGSMKYKIHC